MGGGWTHLSLSERIELEKGIERGLNHSQLARLIGRSRATVIREKRRSQCPVIQSPDRGVPDRGVGEDVSVQGRFRQRGGYSAAYAHELSRQRTARSHQPWKFNNGRLAGYVESMVRWGRSPAQIAGRIRLDFPDDPLMRVSHECVYVWVYRDRPQLRQYLPRGKRRRQRRVVRGAGSGVFGSGRKTVHDRPEEVAGRGVGGHWESDSVLGKRGSGNLHTTVERVSRYLQARIVPDGTASATLEAQHAIYGQLPSGLVRSVTVDNGSEFAAWEQLEHAYGVSVFFCDPYSAWQRGTNEHFNGRLRKYFPKGTRFDTITQARVDEVVYEINNTPRACLGWLTPQEVWDRLCAGLWAGGGIPPDT